MMATFKILGANWFTVDFATAKKKFDIEKLTDNDVSLDDLFPDAPEEFFVHRGNLVVKGELELQADPSSPDRTVYVIDGDLVVDGPLLVQNHDVYTSLFVTGSVRAKSIAVTWDAALFVEGSVEAHDLVFTYLTDAGHFVAKKGVKSKVWLEAGGRGVILADKVGDTTKLEKLGHDAIVRTLLPSFNDGGRVDSEKIVDAMMKGRSVLR